MFPGQGIFTITVVLANAMTMIIAAQPCLSEASTSMSGNTRGNVLKTMSVRNIPSTNSSTKLVNPTPFTGNTVSTRPSPTTAASNDQPPKKSAALTSTFTPDFQSSADSIDSTAILPNPFSPILTIATATTLTTRSTTVSSTSPSSTLRSTDPTVVSTPIVPNPFSLPVGDTREPASSTTAAITSTTSVNGETQAPVQSITIGTASNLSSNVTPIGSSTITIPSPFLPHPTTTAAASTSSDNPSTLNGASLGTRTSISKTMITVELVTSLLIAAFLF